MRSEPGLLHGARGAVLTDRGGRAVNQDAVLLAALSDGAELIAVADGMGGHAAGEVASRLALQRLHVALEAGAALPDAVRAANAAVHAEAAQRSEQHGMGTTVVALLSRDGVYEVANVGDSRAYRADARGLVQLTQDHSFIAEAVRSGQLSAVDAARSRWRNAVTRAVGTEPDVHVDCFGPFDAAEPHAVLLCSDGLYRVIAEDELARLLAHATDAASAVDALAQAASAAGADDNVSVGIIRFGLADGEPVPIAAAAVQPAHGIGPAATAATPAATAPASAAPTAAPAATAAVSPAPVRERVPPGPVTVAPRRPAPRVRKLKPPRTWSRIRLLLILGAVSIIVAYLAAMRLLLT